tara:strand:+ start:45 stop:590 length:546 start_codon:yes stop_codon:yes gene_type:complete
MIVGSASVDEKGEPVWPTLELLSDGYFFTYRSDNGSFLGKIKEFNFEHWMSWIKSHPVNDFIQDTFDLNPKSMGDVMTQLLNHGCNEAKLELEGLMWEYYDQLKEKEISFMKGSDEETYALYIENEDDESKDNYGATRAYRVISWATFDDGSKSGMIEVEKDILTEAESLPFFSGYESGKE